MKINLQVVIVSKISKQKMQGQNLNISMRVSGKKTKYVGLNPKMVKALKQYSGLRSTRQSVASTVAENYGGAKQSSGT